MYTSDCIIISNQPNMSTIPQRPEEPKASCLCFVLSSSKTRSFWYFLVEVSNLTWEAPTLEADNSKHPRRSRLGVVTVHTDEPCVFIISFNHGRKPKSQEFGIAVQGVDSLGQTKSHGP